MYKPITILSRKKRARINRLSGNPAREFREL